MLCLSLVRWGFVLELYLLVATRGFRLKNIVAMQPWSWQVNHKHRTPITAISPRTSSNQETVGHSSFIGLCPRHLFFPPPFATHFFLQEAVLFPGPFLALAFRSLRTLRFTRGLIHPLREMVSPKPLIFGIQFLSVFFTPCFPRNANNLSQLIKHPESRNLFKIFTVFIANNRSWWNPPTKSATPNTIALRPFASAPWTLRHYSKRMADAPQLSVQCFFLRSFNFFPRPTPLFRLHKISAAFISPHIFITTFGYAICCLFSSTVTLVKNIQKHDPVLHQNKSVDFFALFHFYHCVLQCNTNSLDYTV